MDFGTHLRPSSAFQEVPPGCYYTSTGSLPQRVCSHSILVADVHLANLMKEWVIHFMHRFARSLAYTSTRHPHTYMLLCIIFIKNADFFVNFPCRRTTLTPTTVCAPSAELTYVYSTLCSTTPMALPYSWHFSDVLQFHHHVFPIFTLFCIRTY